MQKLDALATKVTRPSRPGSIPEPGRDALATLAAKIRLAIYHLKVDYEHRTGIYRHGFERMDEDRLEKNPKFRRLIVQAKFIRGEIDYSDRELPYLKECLQKNEPKAFYEIFVNRILA